MTDKNLVQYRRIQIGTLEDGLRVVNEGLTADDWVVTSQVSKLRSGITVKPVPTPGPVSPSAAVNPAAELKALDGRWRVAEFKKGGNADASWSLGLEKIDLEKIHFFVFFNGNDFAMLENEQSQAPVFQYAVDPTVRPKTIDLPGAQGEFIALGNYEIEGDRLRVCLAKCRPALKTDQRPMDFSAGPGSSAVVFVLERVKPPPPAATPGKRPAMGAAPRRRPSRAPRPAKVEKETEKAAPSCGHACDLRTLGHVIQPADAIARASLL